MLPRRHVRGSGRLSGDIDATRTNPAKHKLDAQEVAEAMRRASDEPHALRGEYELTIGRLDPDAPPYAEARASLASESSELLP